MVTEPSVSGTTPAQATVASVCAAAQSFVGKAWNQNGCWVLASDIAAEAGASLPVSSAFLGVGESSGQWFVAYDGSSSGNWQSLVTAGEMVSFTNGVNSGHITTVVSGSGSTAQVIDNITYMSGSTITNPANDGSASDIIIASAHSASDEFSKVVPGTTVVIYELDPGPTVITQAESVVAGHSIAASSLIASATDPANDAITEYQFYDPNSSIQLNGATNLIQSGGIYRVSASDLSKLTYVSDSTGNDTLTVWAYDGYAWSSGTTVVVTTTPNIIMTTRAATVIAGHSIAVSSLIGNVTDVDGNAVIQYQIYDPANAIQLNGATNLLSQSYQSLGYCRISAADLSKLTYVGGSTGGDTLTISAYDGYAWSGGTTVTVTTISDAPMVTTQAASVLDGRSFAASNLITGVTDPGNDAITQYQFYDPTDVNAIQLNGATNLLGQGYQNLGYYRISAADLSKLTYVGSTPGSETVTVWANDSYAWSNGTSVTVTTTSDAPTVSTWPALVVANHSITASSLIGSATDPGNDAITMYQFYDPTDVNAIQLNGATNLLGQSYQSLGIYRVSAADLSKLTYAGSTPGSETVTVWANDGYAWSNGTSVTVTTTSDAPTVTTQATSVLDGRSFAASNLITSATDPGNDAITMYQFYDPTDVNAIQLNGATNLLGQSYQNLGIYRVSAADLSKLTYVGSVPGSETVTVWANDSYAWSNGTSVAVTTTSDTPTVTTQATSVVAGHSVGASSLIASATDPGNDPISMFQFYDPINVNAIQLNGATNLLGQSYQSLGIYRVSAADLSKLTYVGSTPGNDSLTVWANDAYGWSNGTSVTVITTSDAPTVTTQATSVLDGRSFTASNLITSATDPGNDAITMYQFYDPTDVNAIQLNGATNLLGQSYQSLGIYRVSAADLSKLTYVGSTPGSEPLYVSAYDGYGWGTATVTVTTTSDTPTVTAQGASVVAGHSVAASNLIVSATDPGNDAIAQYQFYDPTDVNAIQLNGATNLLGQGYQNLGFYRVSAADLSKLTYVGSVPGSEAVTVWANDGYGWSNGTSVTVTTTSDSPTVTTQAATVVTGNTIAASSLITSATDPGNDPISMYQFYDPTNVNAIQLNGATNLLGQGYQNLGFYRVSASDLSKLTYVGGSVGSDTVTVWANDGYGWSNGVATTVSTTANVGAFTQQVSTGSITATAPSLAYSDSVGLGNSVSASLIAATQQHNSALGLLTAKS